MNGFCLIFADNYKNYDIEGLIKNRSLASLPVACRYRIVDFTLSSLVKAPALIFVLDIIIQFLSSTPSSIVTSLNITEFSTLPFIWQPSASIELDTLDFSP